MLVLSNEVAEKEDQLISYRKRELVHEQEDKMRAELCKRLEELLIEKEDIKARNSIF